MSNAHSSNRDTTWLHCVSVPLGSHLVEVSHTVHSIISILYLEYWCAIFALSIRNDHLLKHAIHICFF
ncbi:hypothetical protein ASPTUDRAFT_48024, partial [Aspergillus tubingensis CBS 134.48]